MLWPWVGVVLVFVSDDPDVTPGRRPSAGIPADGPSGGGPVRTRPAEFPYLNRRSPLVAMRWVEPWRFTQSRTRLTALAHCQLLSYSRTPVKAP